MRCRNFVFTLFVGAAILVPSAQTYTDEDVDTYLYPISEMNMQGQQYFWRYIDGYQLPANFNYTRVLGISAVVLRDPSSGSVQVVTPVFRLHRYGGSVATQNGVGGNYSMECMTTPYCYLNLDRGFDGMSFFGNSGYSRTDVNRVYLKIDYRR